MAVSVSTDIHVSPTATTKLTRRNETSRRFHDPLRHPLRVPLGLPSSRLPRREDKLLLGTRRYPRSFNRVVQLRLPGFDLEDVRVNMLIPQFGRSDYGIFHCSRVSSLA